MKKIIMLILLIASFVNLSCDMGIFDLQAVCKITLKSGEIINGFIVVGKGGYLNYYDTNGFYWTTNQNTKPALFNIESKSFELHTGKIIREYGYSSPGYWFKNVQVYYLKDISSKKYWNNRIEIIEKVDSLNVLSRDIVHHNEYKLLNYIPVYLNLPESLYLERGDDVTFEKIYLDSIEIFELVREPSKEIIENIKEFETKLDNKYNKQPHEGDDFYPPVWFHDIIKKKENAKLFKKWVY